MTSQPGNLDLATLRRLMAHAHNRMAELGATCAVAIADTGGVLIALERAEDTPPMIGIIADAKAATAALLGIATSELGDVATNWPGIVEPIKARLGGRFCAYGGAVPLVRNGVRIGAVAISGGSEAQDEEVAREIAAMVAASA